MGFLVWVMFDTEDDADHWCWILHNTEQITAWCNEDEPNVVTWIIELSH